VLDGFEHNFIKKEIIVEGGEQERVRREEEEVG